MKIRFIPALVTLIAAACVSIINIVRKVELLTGLYSLILAIFAFYILGQIAKTIINRSIVKKETTTEPDLQSTEETAIAEDISTNDKADEAVE